MERYKFVFSIIMPVFNAEQFIHGAIEGVLNQTIGFKKNIQLIIVNDGSTDCSGLICDEYQKKYSNNIVVIHKKNGGVSSARNAGLDVVNGKYTVFFDCDDELSHKALKNIQKFFDKHYQEIDMCTFNIKYIGDFSGNVHPLAFQYKGKNKIVDLKNNPSYINSTMCNTVFKTEKIGQQRFDERLIAAEDAMFQNCFILYSENFKVGKISNAVYHYRRNYSNNSLSGTTKDKIEFYIDIPDYFWKNIFRIAKKKYREIPRFIQSIVMYDIQWHVPYRQSINSLSAQELESYKKALVEILLQIDDDIILSSESITIVQRICLLCLKYSVTDIEALLQVVKKSSDVDLMVGLLKKRIITIENIEIKDNLIILEGVINNKICGSELDVWVEDNNLVYEIEITPYPRGEEVDMFGHTFIEGQKYIARVPINNTTKYSFNTRLLNEKQILSPPRNFSSNLKGKRKYFTLENHIIRSTGNKILIESKSIKHIQKAHLLYSFEAIKKHRISELIHEQWIALIKRNAKQKKQISLISYRSDNTLLNNMKEIEKQLRLKNVKVVTFAKKQPHTPKDEIKITKLIYESKVLVIDDNDEYVREYTKPKGQTLIQVWHACGAFKKFGLDGTGSFPAIERKTHKNYDLVIVSGKEATKAYESAFDICRDKIKPLGVPRTDVFFDKQYKAKIMNDVYNKYPMFIGKEIIVYAPTFRAYPGPRTHLYPPIDFKELSRILNPNQIFIICPHPVITKNIIDNEYSNIFEIRDYTTNEIMQISDTLITDYSSVVFEYALLNKPMAFFCYDYDEYNRDFYLDYQNDLPGDIFMNQFELFDYIKNYKNKDKEMTSCKEFVEKYMTACDGHSTERVVDEIMKALEA